MNGKYINNSYIRKFLEENIGLIRRIKPSFFEVNTAMAFKYFADKKADVAVIECGLGGRLDSTNVLKPDVSVITQIDMDHMQYLGNTLIKIAKEKLGIVKKNTKVIVSDNNSRLKKLFHRSIPTADLIYIDDSSKIKITGYFDNKIKFSINVKNGKEIALTAPLSGKYQARNAAAAYYAVNEFMKKNNKSFSELKFKKGINYIKKNTGYSGRLEIIKIDSKKYLLDVSHNPDGIKNALSSANNIIFSPDVIIFGIMSDKDHKAALKVILPFASNIIFTKPEYDRALEPGVLYTDSLKIKSKNNLMIAQSVKDSLKIADKMKFKKIMILGSFFMVSDAYKALGYKKLP